MKPSTMSNPTLPQRIYFRANGDAGSYALMNSATSRWVISVLLNGEIGTATQAELLERMAACWNACDGVPTEELEQGKAQGLIRTIYAKNAATQQRDTLLTAVQRLLASDQGIASCTDAELEAAADDPTADSEVREQAAAILQARRAIRAIGDT